MVKIIPILLGVVGACLVCVIFTVAPLSTVVDLNAGVEGATPNLVYCIGGDPNLQLFTQASIENIQNAAWVGLPVQAENTVFSIFAGGNLDTALLLNAVITIVPISLATVVEHIGDVSAISSTVGKNFIKDPGLHRTLTGDGLATTLASLFGAPANTTYGENTGVLTLSKVYDPLVIELAALFAIFFSFSPKLAACISAIPTPVIGGISLVLYGMISAVGVRNLVENQIDFSKVRNVIIAALILVLSIGVTYSAAGAISLPCGAIGGDPLVISLSGLAVGSLIGIILNAALPGKDYVFEDKQKAAQAKDETIKPEPAGKTITQSAPRKDKKKK